MTYWVLNSLELDRALPIEEVLGVPEPLEKVDYVPALSEKMADSYAVDSLEFEERIEIFDAFSNVRVTFALGYSYTTKLSEQISYYLMVSIRRS